MILFLSIRTDLATMSKVQIEELKQHCCTQLIVNDGSVKKYMQEDFN